MSRKFLLPFDSYELSGPKPRALEIASKFSPHRRKIVKLANNPLYYINAIQFTNGELYRAVLGYELLWDRKTERDLMLCLDYILTLHLNEETYYFEELTVTTETRIHGVKWPRGIAPRVLAFETQWPYELKTGEKLLARVNCLDKPNHVDVERVSTGEVFTLQLVKYLRYREKLMKGNRDYEERRKRRRGSEKKSFNGPETASLRLVGKTGKEKPVGHLSSKLHHLQEGLRRKGPL